MAREEVSETRLLAILNEKLAESDRCKDCTFPGTRALHPTPVYRIDTENTWRFSAPDGALLAPTGPLSDVDLGLIL